MIEISGLTKYYGSLCALDHIDLTIDRGKILGLLGPNGAGKTTAMRIITGYLSPTEGTVTARGLSIREDTLAIKRMIGYLPESAPLYRDMLVYDYLVYVADIRGIPPDRRETRIRELTDVCGLREVMHRSISELSKGFKQRVGLAHAMMGDPEILVLDEPTSGLDPNQIADIRGIIREIGREKTVILSTHILSEVEATCDRVVIINSGRIVADGSTGDLMRSSGGGYTINLTLEGASADDARGVFSAIGGVSAVDQVGPGNGAVALSLRCDTSEDIRRTIYEAVKKRDWTLLEFTREARSLETIFRELTKEN
ncbi:MAG: ATP-binding cassette domain-containing protein [Candidatus Krumholzibacteriota bacterium]|nr:ATP-binding cassette domain-containing protein [Candidatus Krumholzibacteriota bacterium]